MYQFQSSIRKDFLKISKYILLVNDNDKTRKKLQHSPVQQEEWNTYLKKIIAFNTTTIALYIPTYFPSPNKEANTEFLKLLEHRDNILLPYILDNNIQINDRHEKNAPAKLFKSIKGIDLNKAHSFKKVSLPNDEILDYVPNMGFSNFVPNTSDGIIRKIPLLATLDGKLVFSYTLASLISFLKIDISNIYLNGNTLHLTSTKYNKKFKIPLTNRYEMYIHFFKDIKLRFMQTDLYNILHTDKKINLQNHLVINFNTATASSQSYKTPTHPFTPGGLVVAAALNTIVSELFTIPRDNFKMYVSMSVLALIIMILALIFSPQNKSAPLIAKNYLFFLIAILVIILYPLFNFLVFAYLNYELSTAVPTCFAVLFVFLCSTYKLIVENRERRRLTTTLRGFISKEKLEFLITPKGSEMMLKTREKEVSILLTDIVDFGNWSTFQKPDFIFKTLQKYFATLEEVVFKYGGTIDKKMGDALLAFFGDLSDNPDHINDAVNAAIEIQKELRKQNFPFLTRIGINSGMVTIGNLGSDKHLDYTAIGSTVNFTKRIEEDCIPGSVLLGPDSFKLLKEKEKYDISPISIEVKDQEEELTCYNISLAE
jgi:class 3 adenylate cyclase